ncbi:MAG TPA: hypothetical protein VFO66_05565 [Gemmatimonadaceae bacterium]|nr:hypothetical protein [Gemmatimonadaceae bacterium]
MRTLARVLAVVIAACASVPEAVAQDSIAVRHLLALDVGRLAPFRRTYDVIVHRRDSATTIGEREISLERADQGGTTGWLLVERRSGAVAAAESLFVAPDLRPLRWSSALGTARLAAAFLGDTIMGATTIGTAKQNLLVAGRPDLLVSGAMVELVLGLLPLDEEWRDSAAVLSMGVASRDIVPVELVAVGMEDLLVDSAAMRPTVVVALRSELRSALYWVDMESRAVLRMLQVLPAHVGILLEYRLRSPEIATLQRP